MSLLDLGKLSQRELLFHYVLDCQNRSLTLAYADLQVLEMWIQEIQDDAESLLLILSEILPKYYADKTKRTPLKKIQKSVSQKIKEHLLTRV